MRFIDAAQVSNALCCPALLDVLDDACMFELVGASIEDLTAWIAGWEQVGA